MNNEVNINLRKFLDKRLPENILKGLERCGQYIENETKENIVKYEAVDTGTLKGSIKHTVDEKNYAVYVGTSVEYAAVVHEGRLGLGGRPYLMDVADKNVNEIVEQFRKGAEL